MARLSVNLNKIALLRNSRRTGVPDVLLFGRLAYEAGAHGLTVHPRPDQRHIRREDVPALAALMEPWRPSFEFNIEGYPDDDFMALVTAVRPEQCTLVPDGPGVFTSEEGWRLDNVQDAVVRDAVARLKALGCRPVVFVDPDPNIVKRVAATGAQGIEIYTGSYGAAFAKGDAARLLDLCAETAQWAAAYGLAVNVGHDLNLANLPSLVAAIPHLAEASIGHELTADALEMGWTNAIGAYRSALDGTTGEGRDSSGERLQPGLDGGTAAFEKRR